MKWSYTVYGVGELRDGEIWSVSTGSFAVQMFKKSRGIDDLTEADAIEVAKELGGNYVAVKKTETTEVVLDK